MLPQRALPPISIFTFFRILLSSLLVVFLGMTLPLRSVQAVGAPDTTSSIRSSNQTVEYLGEASANRLDLGFSVLVPSYVPSPFSGEPAIDAGGGFYSLYWIVTDGPPTFLQVTGQIGGSLPAGSPYDLNNQLSVNSSVQGYEAIHDVTPAYDAVWWIAGGVAYKVESLNMEGTDSLGLANSLVTLVLPAPAPEEPETEPTVVATEPVGPSQPVQEPTPAEPTAQDIEVGPGEPGLATELEPDSIAPVAGEVTTDNPDSAEPVLEEEVSSGVGSSTDGTGSNEVGSDGTGGPEPPVVGTDGTGGTGDLSVAP